MKQVLIGECFIVLLKFKVFIIFNMVILKQKIQFLEIFKYKEKYKSKFNLRFFIVKNYNCKFLSLVWEFIQEYVSCVYFYIFEKNIMCIYIKMCLRYKDL